MSRKLLFGMGAILIMAMIFTASAPAYASGANLAANANTSSAQSPSAAAFFGRLMFGRSISGRIARLGRRRFMLLDDTGRLFTVNFTTRTRFFNVQMQDERAENLAVGRFVTVFAPGGREEVLEWFMVGGRKLFPRRVGFVFPSVLNANGVMLGQGYSNGQGNYNTSPAAPAYPNATQAPSATAAPATPAAVAVGEATIKVVNNPKLGPILVDGNGMTLYAFKQDTPDTVTCTGACAQVWPALITQGKPVLGKGINSQLIGFATLADGRQVVTLNHMPLYTYSLDTKPGDTNGEGVQGIWYVVSPNGTMVTAATAPAAPKATSQPSTNTGGGGSHY